MLVAKANLSSKSEGQITEARKKSEGRNPKKTAFPINSGFGLRISPFIAFWTFSNSV